MNPLTKTFRWTISQVAHSDAALGVIVLCWLMVVFDGYDLTVYGAVAPSLKAEWGLTASGTGVLGTTVFLGMLVGAVLAGTVSDRIGRRNTVLVCLVWFSVMTVLCALAPSAVLFGLFRFLAGLGLGGMVPTASALSGEYSTPQRRPLVSMVMMSGVPIGGIIAAAVGIPVIGDHGWRPMFWIALVGLVIVFPLCWKFVPESAVWLRARGQIDRAEVLEARYEIEPEVDEASASAGHDSFLGRLRTLFSGPYWLVTTLFMVATIGTLFAWYGLGTWLPSLMRDSGFQLGSALQFTLVLYLGAVIGSLIMGWIGTKVGSLWSGAASALMGVVGLFALTTHPSTFWTYVALVLAGIGTHGTQCLLISGNSNHYPHLLRGSALGFMLGVGRIGAVVAPSVGGWLQDAGLGVNSNFVAFGIGALVACALLLALVPATRASLARVSSAKKVLAAG